MAEKTDKQPALLLLVHVAKKKKKKQARAVQFVSLWALFNAVVFTVSLAVAYTTPSDLLSWLFGPPEENNMGSALELEAGHISCIVLQAATAALALLLAGHRRKTRRALAYVALAVSVASHCTFASDVGGILLTDDPAPPGNLLCRICVTVDIFVFAAGDPLCFLALLRREGRRSRVSSKAY